MLDQNRPGAAPTFEQEYRLLSWGTVPPVHHSCVNPFHLFTTVRDIPHNCNPDNDLPTDFSQKRDTYYEALRQPTEADVFIEKLKEDMRKALRSLDGAMPRIRDKVRLLPNRKKKPISITPLAPQPEPRNLLSLKQEVGTRWPMTSLLD